MRISLAFGAWLDHEPVWLPPEEADAVLAALRDELFWEQREIVLFGRRILQPRLIAWAGDVGYRYSGQTLEPRLFTPAARGLLARVCNQTGVPFYQPSRRWAELAYPKLYFHEAGKGGHFAAWEQPLLNHVLANRYRSGDDSMGLHADDEPELGDDPVVAIVSLGTSRRLSVRPRRKGARERHDVDLGHGSLLIMGGACQRHYVHGVPRQPGLQRERISLTFRRLLRPP
jgi:alkylated DNA repair dioxygenase AlkB